MILFYQFLQVCSRCCSHAQHCSIFFRVWAAGSALRDNLLPLHNCDDNRTIGHHTRYCRCFTVLLCFFIIISRSPLPVILIQNNDEPPCTPLLIVKQVYLGSRTGQGLEKKRRGCICTPSIGILHPLNNVC